jgi:hypothetical protein
MRTCLIEFLLVIGLVAGAQTNGAAPAPPGTPPPSPAPPPPRAADNSRCFVCHANYEEELLSAVHAKANVGCVQCHGHSSPHSTDEDGLTAPDRMYPKAHIRLNCLTCHDWVKLVQNDLVRTNRVDLKDKPDHRAVLEGRVSEKRFCTDCHGEHRMFYRTKGWDKRTGVLLFKDGIPRMVPSQSN